MLELDPENRLLARGPRLRLRGHVIRDQALAAAGLLVEEIGGPSVRPYQPENLWREMSNMVYEPSTGADQYRRSLYTFWKRTVAPPTMALLDAADRESCAVRVQQTNTPLQALTLLNEKVFFESARKLGQRRISEGSDQPVEFAFRAVTGRQPQPAELILLRTVYDEYLAEYRQRPAAAQELIGIGALKTEVAGDPIKLAASTTLANVLLNLDEVVTKE